MNASSSSEPRLRLRERFRDATRDAILDAAAAVFAADGAQHARMEDIALAAGVSVGTVYNHFKDRTALVTALLDVRTRAMLAALDAAVPKEARSGAAGATGAFAAAVEQFVAQLARHFDANRALLSVLLDDELHRGLDATAASRRRTVLQEVLRRGERLAAKGIRAGALQKGDPALYAALLVGMVRGVATTAMGRHDARFADSVREIVRVFLKGASR